MARKKQEIALQAEIESQEEWEEMLSKEGLTVVDVYQDWCGPCKAVLAVFRRIKNEIGDDLLHFAVAKSDTVDALEKYRGKCKPCFLLFAGSCLVACIRGTNVTKLQRLITEQLAQEHKVLDGETERKEIKDPEIVYDEPEKLEDEEEESDKEEEIESVEKEVTLAIIKPNAVRNGQAELVIEDMKAAGLEILQDEERQLTEEECREFYENKKDEPYFEDLIKYMTEGPCHVLVISKEGVGEGALETWRNLLGPPNVEDAKETAPESLRAKYGADGFMNALHGSDSKERAMRELAFFYPNFVIPTTTTIVAKPKIERTIAIIRPDAYRERRDSIMAAIAESGFEVAMSKEVTLTKEQAEEFYKEHEGQPYFESLTTEMSKGPLLALALAREDAVTSWRSMLGPKEMVKAKEEAPESMRAKFSMEGAEINQLHGSSSTTEAQRDLNYFFPVEKTVAVIKPDAYQTKDEIMAKIRQAGFHIAARKETTIPRELAEKIYKGQEDKEFFGDLINHMTDGTTLCLVLTRNDAVAGWRGLMGPTDPEIAKTEAPDSIRANFGVNILQNAVHGSTNANDAEEVINLLFTEKQEDQDKKNVDDNNLSENNAESGSVNEVNQDTNYDYTNVVMQVADNVLDVLENDNDNEQKDDNEGVQDNNDEEIDKNDDDNKDNDNENNDKIENEHEDNNQELNEKTYDENEVTDKTQDDDNDDENVENDKNPYNEENDKNPDEDNNDENEDHNKNPDADNNDEQAGNNEISESENNINVEKEDENVEVKKYTKEDFEQKENNEDATEKPNADDVVDDTKKVDDTVEQDKPVDENGDVKEDVKDDDKAEGDDVNVENDNNENVDNAVKTPEPNDKVNEEAEELEVKEDEKPQESENKQETEEVKIDEEQVEQDKADEVPQDTADQVPQDTEEVKNDDEPLIQETEQETKVEEENETQPQEQENNLDENADNKKEEDNLPTDQVENENVEPNVVAENNEENVNAESNENEGNDDFM